MFITRFAINPQRRGARKLLTSPQAMHAAVLSGFADPEPTEHGRVLWRVDRIGPQTALYIVSPRQPDLSHLVEQAGWPTTEAWESRPYVRFLDQIQAGQRWGFRLVANPVHAVRASEPGTRGTVRAHVTVSQQEQWLLARAAKAGFEITLWDPERPESGSQLAVTERKTVEFKRQNSTVTLSTARFDGFLTVLDPEVFRRTLTHGIGRAKGYGCGLMTIAPAT